MAMWIKSIWLRWGENSKWNCDASLVKRQICLIIFKKSCTQCRNTYQSLAYLSPAERFKSMFCAHLEMNTCNNLEQRLEEDHGFERNANGKMIPITTDKPPAPSYLLQYKGRSENWIEQACYVLALELGTAYSVVQMWWESWRWWCCLVAYWAHVVILENVLFYFDPTFWILGDIDLLYPCYILWI